MKYTELATEAGQNTRDILKSKPKEKQIVFQIINELRGRNGFDYWWNNISDNVQDELIEDLLQKIKKLL